VLLGLYVPAAQGVHTASPVGTQPLPQDDPAGQVRQAWHWVSSAEAWNLPGSQVVQLGALLSVLYDPAWHPIHNRFTVKVQVDTS
jgi:hypothetical protein